VTDLTLDQANAIVTAALAGATQAGLAAASIVVTDRAGAIRAAARTDAAPPFGIEIARGKAVTALGFGRSSLKVAAVFGDKPATVSGLASAVGTFLPLGGGVVVVDAGGAVIGGAGLAGGAPEVDHAIIAAAVVAAGFAALD
jgi:uncharacterized protein GlcG (DUF336 family)